MSSTRLMVASMFVLCVALAARLVESRVDQFDPQQSRAPTAATEPNRSGTARDNAFGLDEGITLRLPPDSKPREYSVDQFGPSVPPFGKTEEIRSGEDVMVRGWAIDAPAFTLAGGMEIVIDGHAYKLPYSIRREDVATAKHKQTYTDCGFLGVVSPQLLPKGSHTVSLRIVSADRKTYYQSPEFHVVVRAT